ncbi:conjugal transfer protein (plasmid) [Acidovorax sp. 210-6]|uniref:type IV secretion system protein VirB3 n=1 Tax=Acidovorax sp. 210-6 TaxID=2699468 RepID=UPI001389614B|nr:VirB3 family type IV secretion system protein [Acidovorax sp. 210-6]NCU67969.1 conjugal transfer protein [Acidovorax sp. 210-6]
MDEIEKQAQLEVDELFVGLTRPATVFGVHFTAFVAEMILVGCVFLAIGNPIWLLLLVPTHSLMYVISSTDPGRFDSLTKYAKTNGRCLNRWFWKSASFTPHGSAALPRSRKSKVFASAKK